ncbi:hypothetical protein ACCE15_19125 [Pseudomonas parafulva]|uniref:hypothetical protein n=1 Tax=Pseudomonas parafulva TaxID=157782 RepID=UPI00356A7B61
MKYKGVELIEELGYEIGLKRSGDGWVDIQLLDKGDVVSFVKTRTNTETIEKMKARISGEVEIKPNTYLTGALDHLFIRSAVHAIKNDRITKDKADEILSNLNEFDQKYVHNSLNEKPVAPKVAEPEHFYLVHSQEMTRSGLVKFSNEFVGTERDFKEYLEKQLKDKFKEIEIFNPEFRNTHREIERIIRCYQHNSGDKSQILESLKGFDKQAIHRLEDRLQAENIDFNDFQNRFKDFPSIKRNPKP